MTHQTLFNSKRLGWTLAATAAVVLAPTAPRAVEITAGDWKFSASGNVNAHYIVSKCEDSPVGIGGGLACAVAPGADDTSSSVSNGLLPAAIALSASTTQAGYDLAATFGFFPGISTNDGSPNLQQGAGRTNIALGTTAIDMRQVFLTFGNDRMGTVLMGRNIGLFGQDAILGDMTLLGVGTVGSNAAPANTSLGSIGLGYIYTDWLAQIDYTTPNFNGPAYGNMNRYPDSQRNGYGNRQPMQQSYRQSGPQQMGSRSGNFQQYGQTQYSDGQNSQGPDFSQSSIKPRDPATGVAFPGNIIPSGRFDIAAKTIQDKYVPLSNLPNNFYEVRAADPINTNEGTIKIDHQLSQSQSFAFSYFHQRGVDTQPLTLTGNIPNSA